MLFNKLCCARHHRLRLLIILELTLQFLFVDHLVFFNLLRVRVLALAPVFISPDTDIDRSINTETLAGQLLHDFLVQFPSSGEVFPLHVGQDDVRAEIAGGQGCAQFAVAGFGGGVGGFFEELEGEFRVVEGEA